jgi:hypothetical protein
LSFVEVERFTTKLPGSLAYLLSTPSSDAEPRVGSVDEFLAVSWSLLGPFKRKPRSGGKRGFHWEARIGGSTRFMDKTREGTKRFKPELKNSNTA